MRFLICLSLFVFTTINFAQSGYLSGRVTDANTKEPLAGANVLINELENAGAATDADGKFKIKLPVGSYSARFSLIGYETVVRTDIVIKTKNELFVEIQLSPTSIKMDEVTVTADYFDKAIIENNLSTISLGVEEVHRSP
ncbi:MAG: carboxypeptidase-like regulatory domain-containing protein, partial [Chlorobi bacterium]|nr:carboxypeptidase-like regulatory domain-containing protein [Chlorobiota bacterium]